MQLLKKVSFGARVAEEETNELGNYFVETDQWERIFNGEIDVVKGDKGVLMTLLREKRAAPTKRPQLGGS